jgi:3-oxoacyl-[acyl-carrier protein] reductase
MCQRLSGKTAVVTGGARGIGRAIVEAFLTEGALVAAWDLAPPPAPPDAVGDISSHTYEYLVGDVATESEVGSLVDATLRALGSIDILVNNAGIMMQSPFQDILVADWDRVLAVNLRAVFLCSRAVLPGMTSRRSGRIINIASQLGQIGGLDMAHYCASKAGVIGLTKALAREVAGDNVLVNAIAPTMIDTVMTSELEEGWRDAKLASLPIHRLGRVEEVAEAAVFLASESASYFVGQTLGPNGGDVML